MKKKLLLLTLIFALLLPVSANAANPKKVIYLEHGKTYKSYDVTGNGTKDKFKYSYNSNRTRLNLYLNGTLRTSISVPSKGSYLQLCSLNNNTVFLSKVDGYSSACEPSLYIYSNKTFKKVFSYSSFKKATPYIDVQYMEPSKVTSNSITMNFSMEAPSYIRSMNTFKKSSTPISWNVKYNVKNKKLSLASRTYLTTQKKFTALTTFKTSTTAPTSKYNSFTVKKGDKITLLKIYCPSNGKQWYKIRKGSKEGWFQDSSSRLLK